MSERQPAPPADEVELSAFGPGYGECLLVHLGDGDWMIVDSCVAPDDTIPVLAYLRELGVDPGSAVKLVVATHWHDDHVRGMAEVLETCREATFACSGVLSPRQLVEAIGSLKSTNRFDAARTTSGVDEMRRTLQLLKPGTGRPAAVWSVEGLLLFRRANQPCEVTALAPGQRALSVAYQQIAPLVREGMHGRVPKPNQNLGAVVLWIQVGDVSLLLGADLEETPDPQTGWTAVCDCTVRPGGRAEVFKVPHHGSKNGHQERVWDELLVMSPEAVVCPHSLAGNHLPTPEDIQRLCQLGRVHLTAPPGPGFAIRRGRRTHPATPGFGRVTLRRRIWSEAPWTATYDPPAADPCRFPPAPVQTEEGA